MKTQNTSKFLVHKLILLTYLGLQGQIGFSNTLSKAVNMDQLLNRVLNDQSAERLENIKREEQFKNELNSRAKLLKEAKAELATLEAEEQRTIKKFDTNEKKLAELEEKLRLAMGTLGEMFGVVRQVSGDLTSQFQTSLVSAEFPGRKDSLVNLAAAKSVPNIKELEGLWYQIMREITESGKITEFETEVTFANGEKKNAKVTRIGAFNVITNGLYLNWQPETQKLVELARQPDSNFLSMASHINGKTVSPFAIDPSRGTLLSLLVQAPTLEERVHQGGIVGYIILALLGLGLMFVFERLIYLSIAGSKIRRQLKSETINTDNALGRILAVYNKNKNADFETLELKIDEEILKSIPPIERGIKNLKILAAVAPLLGLLGTVTGMIATFQSITLFGTGDPKLMAGGISQALITTVLGLVAAIPLIVLHSFISGKSQQLIQIIEEQSAGIIAQHVESDHSSHHADASN